MSAMGPGQPHDLPKGQAGQEGATVATDDEELWAPFLAFRPEDRQAARLRRHVEQDMKRGARHVPRRAAALSRDEIVRTAIKVADAEGPDAISMRRIARELNAGTMSLYWHVASKEELLDLMIDTVQGEQQAPEPSGDWRADLRALTRNARAALHRHQWMVDFMGGRPPVGPKALQNLEHALGSLDGLGLDKATAVNIVLTVSTYALGTVLREAQEVNGERYLEQQFEGLTEEERDAMLGEFISRIRASGRYPHMTAVIEAGIDPDAPETRDERFEFGLECLLDGIEARLPARPASPLRTTIKAAHDHKR
jgi:AcrR family transcriptional regulator